MKLKINDICPYCGRKAVVFDYEGANCDFVFATCLACGYESDRFNTEHFDEFYERGRLFAHLLACNFVSFRSDYRLYEIDDE